MTPTNWGDRRPRKKRYLMADYARQFVGRFYIWGGDDPSGWDCSGLVVEALKAVGLMREREDLTAEGLRRKFHDKVVPRPYTGCIVFYVNDEGRAFHTGIMLDSEHAVEAAGGSRSTVTLDAAIRDNAFVKIRPWWMRRPAKIVFVDPWAQEDDNEGGGTEGD